MLDDVLVCLNCYLYLNFIFLFCILVQYSVVLFVQIYLSTMGVHANHSAIISKPHDACYWLNWNVASTCTSANSK